VKNYYNDGLGYCPMTIFKNKEYKYIFRYYGDSALWAKAKSSEIFICYAYEDNKGGSEGNNSFRWKWGLKDRVVKAFENEFINKVDSALGY
jgi:hypothetical protein